MVNQIGKNEPLKAKRVMEAVSDEKRLEIIHVLLKSGQLTASQISQAVQITVPTVLHHLALLAGAEIIRFNYVKLDTVGREVKHWSVVDPLIYLQLDLETFSLIRSWENIQDLAIQYINTERGKGFLPPPQGFRVGDIRENLRVDSRVAEVVFDWLMENTEEIAMHLSLDARKLFEGIPLISMEDLMKKLQIEQEWAIAVLNQLVRSGDFKLVDMTTIAPTRE
ncbi:MAG: winged helix-turn-helix domain-containing protein [Candidatus Heimdallarchaeota archaeon]